MGIVGLAYTVVLIIAWYYHYKEQVEFQELALRIAIWLFFIISLFSTLKITYHLLIQSGFWMPGVSIWGISKLTLYIETGVNLFYLLLSAILLIPSLSKNLKVSTIWGIFLFIQFLACFISFLSLERLFYIIHYKDHIPSFQTVDVLWVLIGNSFFFTIWILFFFIFKQRVKPKVKNVSIDDHLIEN